MRLASVLVILSLSCLIVVGSCAPVLVRSSNKLNQLKHNYFLESSEFVDRLAVDYDQVDNLPKTVFVFEVMVDDQEALQQSKLLISKLNNMQSIRENFNNPDYAYASNYINYEEANDITSRLYDKLVEVKPDYQEFAFNLKDFLSLTPEEITGKATDNLIHRVTLNLRDLNFLDLYLQNNLNKIEEDTSNKYLICILFNFKQARSLQQSVLTPKKNYKFAPKILAQTGDTEAANANEGATATANANEGANENEAEDNENANSGYGTAGIHVTPNGLSGILVSLFILLVILVGVSNLMSIQTPIFFARSLLNIGKEQI